MSDKSDSLRILTLKSYTHLSRTVWDFESDSRLSRTYDLSVKRLYQFSASFVFIVETHTEHHWSQCYEELSQQNKKNPSWWAC